MLGKYWYSIHIFLWFSSYVQPASAIFLFKLSPTFEWVRMKKFKTCFSNSKLLVFILFYSSNKTVSTYLLYMKYYCQRLHKLPSFVSNPVCLFSAMNVIYSKALFLVMFFSCDTLIGIHCHLELIICKFTQFLYFIIKQQWGNSYSVSLLKHSDAC